MTSPFFQSGRMLATQRSFCTLEILHFADKPAASVDQHFAPFLGSLLIADVEHNEIVFWIDGQDFAVQTGGQDDRAV